MTTTATGKTLDMVTELMSVGKERMDVLWKMVEEDIDGVGEYSDDDRARIMVDAAIGAEMLARAMIALVVMQMTNMGHPTLSVKTGPEVPPHIEASIRQVESNVRSAMGILCHDDTEVN